MTSKLTRDIIQSEIADFFAGVVEIHTELGGPNTVEEAQNQLTDRVLACVPVVDSEPVGEFYEDGPKNWYQISDGDRAPAHRRIPLYRHAQPAKGLELAGWQFKSVNGDWLGLIGEHGKNQAVREGCEVREVFAMADGVNDRDQVRREHAEWSQATFGNVGPVGPLKHLSKEALEAATEPDDLSEWADMQFLLWDAQRRAGITDEQITQAMIEKLAVNKLREWPEPKDGEPRLHIKEQSAPVMPNFKKLARELVENLVDCGCLDAGVEEQYLKWTEKTCRSAMLPAPPTSTETGNI
ncbi:Eaa1 [Klebsiella quasipneumoniae]|nr:Eaa1 [Klebsiella quasipneumoniae]